MNQEVKIPVVGESITTGVLAQWHKSSGDSVQVDDPLFDLETDKVTMTVVAEATGHLNVTVAAGTEVEIGQVVATIDTAASGQPDTPKAEDTSATAPGASPAPEANQSSRRPKTSPSVRRDLADRDVDPSALQATGRRNRLTRDDVARATEAASRQPGGDDAPNAHNSSGATPTCPTPNRTGSSPAERQTRRPMSPLRQRLSDRLVQVQQTSAILTTFNEADMSRMLALRQEFREPFRNKHGVDLGLMSFFVRAVVDALQAVPRVNAFIQQNEIVENHYFDIGVAVSTDAGLVVPVIRNADQLSMPDIERTIAELAQKARDRKLTLADLSGGVFSISNGGVFGSLLSTPILNPPQSAILGLHAIKKRPVVVDDQIVVRPMMYLAVSYDHRLIDGREAVTFLKRIVDCVERPERIWLDV